MSRAFTGSRYGRGDDYINCPMTRQEYDAFYRALIEAEVVPLREFEQLQVFEGCMPIESIAARGYLTMAHGPLKPVGLDGEHHQQPFAVVQLRQDNAAGTLYNLVGFQTRLRFPEQKRVFSLIPALHDAEFVRYGVMHRNTYIDSPRLLDGHYGLQGRPQLFFAGQITGVEGYVESAGSGLVAGQTLAARMLGCPDPDFSAETVIGSMAAYVANPGVTHLEPMNANLGLLADFPEIIRDKRLRSRRIIERSLARIDQLAR
jgi:methylenetetrahydrofolate--tRNA-(uracil-5-)-methyltransferase